MALTRRQMARIMRLVRPEVRDRTAVHTGTRLVSLRQFVLHTVKQLAHQRRFVAEERTALSQEGVES